MQIVVVKCPHALRWLLRALYLRFNFFHCSPLPGRMSVRFRQGYFFYPRAYSTQEAIKNFPRIGARKGVYRHAKQSRQPTAYH